MSSSFLSLWPVFEEYNITGSGRKTIIIQITPKKCFKNAPMNGIEKVFAISLHYKKVMPKIQNFQDF